MTLIQSKDRVLEAFKNFHTHICNHFTAKLKNLRSNNGGEYTSLTFKQNLAQHVITHETSCPYTPQQNGAAERKNIHLMEVTRSMNTNVPKRFWSDAMISATYLINRTPTKVLNDLSPFEVLNKTKSSLDHMHVFGCLCFVMIPEEQRNKLDAKSSKTMFIGYSPTQKGYKCYNPKSRRVIVSGDVKFVESKGYYDKKSWESLQDLSQGPSDKANNLRIILENLGISHPQTSGVPTTSTTPLDVDEDAPRVETSHPNPEGGNEPESQQQEQQQDDSTATQDQDGAEFDQSSEDQCSGEQG